MSPEQVVAVLTTGLTPYGIQAQAEIDHRPEGRWGVTLDFEPDGLLLEGMEGSRTVRVMWSGGTDDYASLGKALDYCVKEAGQPLADPHPRLFGQRDDGRLAPGGHDRRRTVGGR